MRLILSFRIYPQSSTLLYFYSESKSIKVLVPGAGLGRLVFEIARNGYTCQGNEFSLFMLIASNFVINRYFNFTVFREKKLSFIKYNECVLFIDVLE